MEIIRLNTKTPKSDAIRTGINSVLNASIMAADPYYIVSNALSLDGSTLKVKRDLFSLDLSHGTILISFGKASIAMSKAAINIFGHTISKGICVTKSMNNEYSLPPWIDIIQSGHPNPTNESIVSANIIKSIIDDSDPECAVVCLISGGGSALVTKPSDGITLGDYQRINQLMLSEQLTIEEMNTVRKHMDEFKGGGLLRWIGNRIGISLIISDVISGDLATIASGPTIFDPSTYKDVAEILKKVNIWERAPKSITNYLEDGMNVEQNKTMKPLEFPKDRYINLLIGSIDQSMEAAKASGEKYGWQGIIMKPLFRGDLDQIADRIIADLHSIAPSNMTRMMIYGGEGTVKLRGNGHGGRNSYLSLLLAERIKDSDGITIATFATDGEDGNSPAAGAIIDTNTYSRANLKGMEIGNYVMNSDSYQFFYELQDAIVTGSTGTNVNDLVLVIIEKDKE